MNSEQLTVSRAAGIIKSGGVIGVPTETVYGLAANALDEAAVRRIFEIKGRAETKALSVLVSGPGAIEKYCADVSRAAHILASRFWPGPLTLVLKARDNIPAAVRAGGDTLGLRCPRHPVALALLEKCGLPLVCSSANPSGTEDSRTARGVSDYFGAAIDGVLDGGECEIGEASTVADLSVGSFHLLRRGALTEGEIEAALRESLCVVGVTGGSGAGKTTALAVLKSLGALTLDCDEIYHGLLADGGEMRGEIREKFPAVFSGGELDRKALGATVFSNAAALLKLNEITHRHVLRRVEQELTGFAARGGELVAIDAVALIESGLADSCTATVGILAPSAERIDRITLRERVDGEYAALRIKAQKDDAFYRENCGHIIENSGDRASFSAECEKLFVELFNNWEDKICPR